LNEDITFLAAETNVSQAEIALQWVNVMLGEAIQGKTRCIILV
jgi:hypothetical protein